MITLGRDGYPCTSTMTLVTGQEVRCEDDLLHHGLHSAVIAERFTIEWPTPKADDES